MTTGNTLLKVKNLTKYFPVHKGIIQRVAGYVKAVDDIDLDILEGEMAASCIQNSLFIDKVDHPATPVSVAGVYWRTRRGTCSRICKGGMGQGGMPMV